MKLITLAPVVVNDMIHVCTVAKEDPEMFEEFPAVVELLEKLEKGKDCFKFTNDEIDYLRNQMQNQLSIHQQNRNATNDFLNNALVYIYTMHVNRMQY